MIVSNNINGEMPNDEASLTAEEVVLNYADMTVFE